MRPARASILLAVMVVIAVGALIGLTVMYRFDAWRGGAAVGFERDRLRALAWSGVQGAMAEIEGQRGLLLEGGAPVLTPEWELWDAGGVRGVVRVVSVQAEGGKLDVNRADAAMMCGLTAVGQDLAAKIEAGREGGELDSVEAVGAFEGAAPAAMFGDGVSETPPMLDVLTAFAFEPDTQAALVEGATAGAGSRRLHVSVGWSEEVKKQLAERMSAPGLAAAEVALRGEPAASDAELVARMRAAAVPPAAWGEVLDVLCTGDDEYRRGRIDLSNAPAVVLACVPGLNAELAGRIVERRAGLDARTRNNVAWPVTEGVIPAEAFGQAADWLTTRSVVWRVRVEAVIEETETEASARQGPPRHPSKMVWDAVIDACEERARVAYLRDVTYQRLVRAVVAEAISEPKEANSADGADVPADNDVEELPAEVVVVDVATEKPLAERGGTHETTDRRIGRWRAR